MTRTPRRGRRVSNARFESVSSSGNRDFGAWTDFAPGMAATLAAAAAADFSFSIALRFRRSDALSPPGAPTIAPPPAGGASPPLPRRERFDPLSSPST